MRDTLFVVVKVLIDDEALPSLPIRNQFIVEDVLWPQLTSAAVALDFQPIVRVKENDILPGQLSKCFLIPTFTAFASLPALIRSKIIEVQAGVEVTSFGGQSAGLLNRRNRALILHYMAQQDSQIRVTRKQASVVWRLAGQVRGFCAMVLCRILTVKQVPLHAKLETRIVVNPPHTTQPSKQPILPKVTNVTHIPVLHQQPPYTTGGNFVPGTDRIAR